MRRFYESHRDALFTYALALAKNREVAEDIVHGAIARLLELRQPPEDLRPYVFRMVRNAAMDDLRRNTVRNRDQFIFNGRHTEPPAAGAGHDIEFMLTHLGDDERECIVMKLYNGLTFQEIADVRGVPVSTAASWYRRGLEKLQAMTRENEA
ncbi:MAG: hypothetical protein AMXMBFR84_11360 [Candidatus Hydrogenedentota bacterium]